MKAIYVLVGILIMLVLVSGCEKGETQEGTVTTPEEAEETTADAEETTADAEETTADAEETEERTAEQNKELLEQLMEESGIETTDEEDTEETTDEEEETTPSEAEITIENFQGTPDEVTISAGGTVTWTSAQPNFMHRIGIRLKEDGGTYGDTINELGEISEGESYSFTFEEAGEYQWYSSTNYPTTVGTVTVE
jgi:plastocyanin